MKEKQLNESLKNGEIKSQYLLMGSEPILIERALGAIRDALGVEESFDVDRFILPEVTTDDVVAKLYLMPLASEKRLLIVKNLEDVSKRDLDEFAEIINQHKSANCLVMTYVLKKDVKYYAKDLKNVIALFPDARYVDFTPARNEIKKWIRSKVERDKMNLDDAMIDYLEEEFSNDITGLKNELAKIENYLEEVGSMDKDKMRDLAKGLCNFDKYQMADAFLGGHPSTLRIFEEQLPYVDKKSMIIMVDSLTRRIQRRASGAGNPLQARKTTLQEILKQLIAIDRKIKTSSIFIHLSMELFFLQNAGAFKNGVSYGR
jgi:DNA polymerase III delta subunit